MGLHPTGSIGVICMEVKVPFITETFYLPLSQERVPPPGTFPSAAQTRGFACCPLGRTCPGQPDIKGQL